MCHALMAAPGYCECFGRAIDCLPMFHGSVHFSVSTWGNLKELIVLRVLGDLVIVSCLMAPSFTGHTNVGDATEVIGPTSPVQVDSNTLQSIWP